MEQFTGRSAETWTQNQIKNLTGNNQIKYKRKKWERREILYENDILEHDIMCDKIVKTLSMTNVCLSPKNMGEEEKNENEKGLGLKTGQGQGDKIFKKMQINENNKINSNQTEK